MTSVLASGRDLARSAVDRLVQRAGDRPASIRDLISPLRYDIVIRANYFSFLAEHIDLFAADFPAYVEEALRLPYYTWFEHVAVARYHADRMRGPADLRAAFEERLRRSTALYKDYQRRGFDIAHPIALRFAAPGARTTSGKEVRRPLYAGDGCHRIALLYNDGITELPRTYYRVRRQPVTTVIDNTHLLLPLVRLSPEQYFFYVSLAYAAEPLADADALLSHVEATRPDRLAELQQVLHVDVPALTAAAQPR